MRTSPVATAVLFAGLSLAQSTGDIALDEAKLIVSKSAWTQKVRPQLVRSIPGQVYGTMSVDNSSMRDQGMREGTVRWESAPVVKQALAQVYGPNAVTSAHDRYYVVSTAGFIPFGGWRKDAHTETDPQATTPL